MFHVQFHTMCFQVFFHFYFPLNRKENIKYQCITHLFILILSVMVSRSTQTRTLIVSDIFSGELFVASSFHFRFTDISLTSLSRTLQRLLKFKHSEIKYPVVLYSCRKSTSLVCVKTTLSRTSWNDVSCYSVDGKQNMPPNRNC